MRRTTQVLVALIGVTVVGIAVAHLFLGGAAVIGGSPLNATAEHRFFAALFPCYGLAFLWCVPGIQAKRRHVDLLAEAFLFAGLARLASVAISGPPKRLLFGDAGGGAHNAVAAVLPDVQGSAIHLTANGFGSVTGCTARA